MSWPAGSSIARGHPGEFGVASARAPDTVRAVPVRRRLGSPPAAPAQPRNAPKEPPHGRLPVVSDALRGFFDHVVDHVVATRLPLRFVDLFQHADREAVDVLRCLGLVHVHKLMLPRRLTWVWPTREGCRRYARPELATAAAELFEHLQTATKQDRHHTISLDRAAAASGWDAGATAVPLLLLNHTACATISPLTQETFNLHIFNVDEFLACDASRLRNRSEWREPVQTAAELRTRYADGEREVAVVEADAQDFRGATLDGLRIHHGTLRGANFHGATFRGATLGAYPPTRIRTARNVDHFGLDLSGADFAGACFEGADLRAADLTDARLDGARFDASTQIPELSLSRAKWDLVYRDEQVVRRGEWGGARRDAAPAEPEFSLVHDRAIENWTVKMAGEPIKTVKNSPGIRLCALLLANARQSIHALDLRAALEVRPPQFGRLELVEHAGGELTEALRVFELRELSDATPEIVRRLWACLRELERLNEPERSCLLEQMKAELSLNRLNMTGMPYVQNIVNNLRKQAKRGLAALAGDELVPLVSAIGLGEFFSYKRP
jgi:hypothetical protein